MSKIEPQIGKLYRIRQEGNDFVNIYTNDRKNFIRTLPPGSIVLLVEKFDVNVFGMDRAGYTVLSGEMIGRVYGALFEEVMDE